MARSPARTVAVGVEGGRVTATFKNGLLRSTLAEELARLGRLQLWLKVAYSAYVAIVVPCYWVTYTPWNFLYFCDIAMLTTAPALWLESSLLVSMQTISIAMPQLLWVVDLLCRLMLGIHVTGVTAYMLDPSLSLPLRLLSSFHGWLPFLLLWLTWRLGYDSRAFAAQSVVAVVVLLVSYAFAPAPPPSPSAPHAAVNINYVYGLKDDHPQTWIAPHLWVLTVLAVNLLVFCLPTHLALRRCFPSAAAQAR